ncbi:MAG: hypothetical protein ACXVHX_34330 [Solirubrobacteraceae bacterium]
MGLFIADELTEADEWLEMSHAARTSLVELWSYCKRAGNNGVIKTVRLHRASDAYTPEVLAELIAHGWAHKDGTGCGTDFCPPGLDGYTVMHNYVRWQESASEKRARIEQKSEAGKRGMHKRWHTNKGIKDPSCEFCAG